MLDFLRKLWMPIEMIDEQPIVVAWDSDFELTLHDLASAVSEIQPIFDLLPSAIIDAASLIVYADQNEYFKIWLESGEYVHEYLKPQQIDSLPIVPRKCVVLQICYYDRTNRPTNDPNYKGRKLDPSIPEHLWDRIVWKLQEMTSGICIVSDEGVYSCYNELIVKY